MNEFLHSRMAFHTSAPCFLALLIMDFIILTADSVLLFALGGMGTGTDMLDAPVMSTITDFHRGVIRTIVRD